MIDLDALNDNADQLEDIEAMFDAIEPMIAQLRDLPIGTRPAKRLISDIEARSAPRTIKGAREQLRDWRAEHLDPAPRKKLLQCELLDQLACHPPRPPARYFDDLDRTLRRRDPVSALATFLAASQCRQKNRFWPAPAELAFEMHTQQEHLSHLLRMFDQADTLVARHRCMCL